MLESWNGPEWSSGGDNWFDVRDYGAFPDVYAYCATTIQAAIDAASAYAVTNNVGVTVYLPTTHAAYRLERSLRINTSRVRLYSPIGRSCLSCQGDFPAIILAIPQTGTQAMDATFRPDAFGLGVLDSTAVTAANQKHGFRTKQNAFLCFQQTSFDLGIYYRAGTPIARTPDRFATQQQLTFEMCLAPGDTTIHTLTPVGFLCGAGTGYAETPFVLNAIDGGSGNVDLAIRFRTAELSRTAQFSWTAQCHLSGSGAGQTDIPGPWDICWQMDLINGQYMLIVNGIVRAFTASNLPAASSTRTLQMNILCPFNFFASNGAKIPLTGNPNSYPDLSLWGARLSESPLYVFGGAGTTQTRLDAQPVNSNTRYFLTSGTDYTTLALLAMSDVASGEAVISGYHHVFVVGPLGYRTGASTQLGLFLTYGFIGGQIENAIENIDINTDSLTGVKVSGYGIAVGGCLNLAVTNCKIYSGGFAIGSYAIGAVYVVYVRGCELQGTDSNVYFFDMHVILENNQYLAMGNFCIKFCGCRWTSRGGFSGDTDNSPYALVASFGGDYDAQAIFEDHMSDTESGSYRWAALYFQAAGYQTATVTVRDVTILNGSAGAMVWLDDVGTIGGVYQKGQFTAENITGNSGSALKVSGPGWQGRLKATGGSLYPRIVHTQEYGTACNVRLIDDGQEPRFGNANDLPIVGPPQEGWWQQGAHEYLVARPQPGQPSAWVVTTSGMIGSSSPPVFAAINPLACPVGTLTGFAGTHARATAVLTA